MTNHKDFHVLKSQGASLVYKMSQEANTMALHYPEATWISTVLPDEHLLSIHIILAYLLKKHLNYFTFLISIQHWQCSTQDSHIVSPAQTIQAPPPSALMPFGRGNTVLIAHKSGELLSLAASECYAVVQVKFIFQPITEAPYLNQPFLHIKFFNFLHSLFNTFNDVRIVTPTPVTDMFFIHWHVQSNNTALGDIVPQESVHQVIELILEFSQQVSLGWECYVNNFADKETFHAILSYQ
ncbi:hypothetical protein BDR04DRAFT_1201164 [Suillus decipiens]|nr:hypothetical protein BDR04DRAFT_1201164 [Suillus decipiens]